MTGQPRRQLFTSGWSDFVSFKKLVPGDVFVFLRYAFVLKITMKFGAFDRILISKFDEKNWDPLLHVL